MVGEARVPRPGNTEGGRKRNANRLRPASPTVLSLLAKPRRATLRTRGARTAGDTRVPRPGNTEGGRNRNASVLRPANQTVLSRVAKPLASRFLLPPPTPLLALACRAVPRFGELAPRRAEATRARGVGRRRPRSGAGASRLASAADLLLLAPTPRLALPRRAVPRFGELAPRRAEASRAGGAEKREGQRPRPSGGFRAKTLKKIGAGAERAQQRNSTE